MKSISRSNHSHVKKARTQEEHIILLGRLEEAIILATLACGTNATTSAIQDKIGSQIGTRKTTNVTTTLDRLSQKGFIDSFMENSGESRRGGRRRRIFNVTNHGVSAVQKSLSLINMLANQAGLKAVG